MSELANKITNIQEELNRMKTTQATSNDSYIFYRYSWHMQDSVTGYQTRWYRATFTPYNKSSDYIVNFHLSDRFPGQVLNESYMSLTDKNICDFTVTAPFSQPKFDAYMTCYSTTSGELSVIETKRYS